jgi:PmbA protein
VPDPEVLLGAVSRVSEGAEVMEIERRSAIARTGLPGGCVDASWRVVSLRIRRNGRLGTAAADGSAGEAELADRAIAMSRFGPPSGAPFAGPDAFRPVECVHPQVDAMGADDLEGLLVSLEVALAERWPRSTLRGSVRLRRERFDLRNTNGFRGSYARSLVDLALTACLAGPEGLVMRTAAFTTGLPLLSPELILDGLLPPGRLMRFEDPPRSPDGRLPVVLSPQVLSVLLSTLRVRAAGWTRTGGASPIAVGDRVGSPLLSIHDRPRLPFGGAAAPFDAQGVPTSDRLIVREGLFASHVHDLESAHAAGCESTGSAGGEPGGLHVPVCTNLVLETGPGDLGSLLELAGSGLYAAEALPGAPGSVSWPVCTAFVIRDGVPGPCTRFRLGGGTEDLLGRISAVEDSLHGVGTDRLPHLLLEPVPVLGF